MALSAIQVLGLLLYWLACAASAWAKTVLPVVLWHGMGDSCCNPLSIGAVRDAIRKRYGKFTHCSLLYHEVALRNMLCTLKVANTVQCIQK